VWQEGTGRGGREGREGRRKDGAVKEEAMDGWRKGRKRGIYQFDTT